MSYPDLPDDFERRLHAKMQEMFAEAEKIQGQIDSATKDGREVTTVLASPDTRRGDIIEVKKFDEEHPDGDPNSVRKARVLVSSPVDLWNPDTQQAFPGTEVLCVILEDDDLTTVDEFESLYGAEGDDDERAEVQEASQVSGEEVSVESVPGVPEAVEVTTSPVRDPHVCECGADRQMCMRNQDLVGMHINE